MATRHVVMVTLALAGVAVGATSWYLRVEGQGRNRISLVGGEGKPAEVPLGIIAGAGQRITVPIDNPFTNDPHATADGRRLFRAMNCASCHGYDAKGGMGPDLTDVQWRYGGTPVDLFKSIYEGRPKGMPAWGGVIPSSSIWQLVTYIETLGETGKTGSKAPNQQAAAGEGQ